MESTRISLLVNGLNKFMINGNRSWRKIRYPFLRRFSSGFSVLSPCPTGIFIDSLIGDWFYIDDLSPPKIDFGENR